jgi:ketosteroid isomerase-like protein
MHPNGAVIEKLYTCFKELDGDGMAQCYHENAEFSDPVFQHLKGSEIEAMWKMLCSQARGFELIFNDVQADAATGSAHWEAKYTFSKTGRQVHNSIKASFRFREGKIIEHRDSFNFWKWSIMALGPIGSILGWSPLLKNKVRRQAAKNLEKYIQNSNE